MKVEKSEIGLDVDIPEGSFLPKTLCVSIDPYIRERMREITLNPYTPPFAIGQPMDLLTMTQIIQSKNKKFKAGNVVYGVSSSEGYALVSEERTCLLKARNEAKNSGIPLSHYIGVLDMPGMTAYVG